MMNSFFRMKLSLKLNFYIFQFVHSVKQQKKKFTINDIIAAFVDQNKRNFYNEKKFEIARAAKNTLKKNQSFSKIMRAIKRKITKTLKRKIAMKVFVNIAIYRITQKRLVFISIQIYVFETKNLTKRKLIWPSIEKTKSNSFRKRISINRNSKTK